MSFGYVQSKGTANRDVVSNTPTLIDPWYRNPSWIPIPTVLTTDEKFVGVLAVYSGAPVTAVTVSTSTGAYLVDWGDGTTSTTASGVAANHTYDYNQANLVGTEAPVTFTASTSTVNRTAHGYVDGNTVSFTTIVTTTGLTATQLYYVVNSTANTFQVSLTPGGSPITLTNDGTGTILPYRQAIVTITPAAGGATIAKVNVTIPFSGTSSAACTSNSYLDISLASQNTSNTNHIFAINSRRAVLTERIRLIKYAGNDMSTMFQYCVGLRSCSVNATGVVTTVASMFLGCTSLTHAPELVLPATINSSAGMFSGCTNLVYVPAYNWRATSSMSYMFDGCKSLVTAPNLKYNSGNLSYLFQGCNNLRNLPFMDTSGCTTMVNMFANCYSLQGIPLIDTSTVSSTNSMFLNCHALVDVPRLNLTAASNTASMFQSCYALTTVPELNLPAVTNASSMFNSCRSMVVTPTMNFSVLANASTMFASCAVLQYATMYNLTTATNVSLMFNNCLALVYVPPYDLQNATTAAQMFEGCISLISTPPFNLSAATTLSMMFNGCQSLNSVGVITTSNTLLTNISNMFYVCAALAVVPPMNFNGVTSSANQYGIFDGCYSLCRMLATGMRWTFSVASCKLSSASLNEIYTKLPTVTGQTITVTGNYGTTGDNPTIATVKGWTVTG